MPLDERWDRLPDDDWSRFVEAWLEELRTDPDADDGVGLSVTIMGFTARPEQQWKFNLAAVERAQSDDELGHIAAGPVECLLGRNGSDYIERVEQQAAADLKFARMMTGVWQYMMPDEIWSRVQAIQQKAEPLRFAKND